MLIFRGVSYGKFSWSKFTPPLSSPLTWPWKILVFNRKYIDSIMVDFVVKLPPTSDPWRSVTHWVGWFHPEISGIMKHPYSSWFLGPLCMSQQTLGHPAIPAQVFGVKRCYLFGGSSHTFSGKVFGCLGSLSFFLFNPMFHGQPDPAPFPFIWFIWPD